MAPKLIGVRHLGDYRLEVRFENGLTATIDLKQRVLSHNGIWLPLRDVEYFKKARVDSDLATVVWPNGVDICPDVLYGLATGKPLPETETGQPELTSR